MSLGCHAALLALLSAFGTRTWRLERPIVVTLLGDAGGGGSTEAAAGAGGSPDGADAARPPATTAVEPMPPVTDLRAAPPPSVSRSAAAPLRARATRRETARAAPARPAPAPPARGRGGGDDGNGDGSGSAAAGGDGTGGGNGSGNGNGSGSGAGGDLRASCASCPAPDYPARARRRGWQGTVDVEVRVAGDGAVEEARIGRSSGFPVLDDAAVVVARRSRFHVAGRTPVSGQLRYRFLLEPAERPL